MSEATIRTYEVRLTEGQLLLTKAILHQYQRAAVRSPAREARISDLETALSKAAPIARDGVIK